MDKKRRGSKERGTKKEDFRAHRTPAETFSLLDMKPISYHDRLPRRFIRTNNHSICVDALVFYALHPLLPQSYPLSLPSHQLRLQQGHNRWPSNMRCPAFLITSLALNSLLFSRTPLVPIHLPLLARHTLSPTLAFPFLQEAGLGGVGVEGIMPGKPSCRANRLSAMWKCGWVPYEMGHEE